MEWTLHGRSTSWVFNCSYKTKYLLTKNSFQIFRISKASLGFQVKRRVKILFQWRYYHLVGNGVVIGKDLPKLKWLRMKRWSYYRIIVLLLKSVRTVDNSDRYGGCDENGWSYAPSFETLFKRSTSRTSVSEMSHLSLARRRRWVVRRKCVGETERKAFQEKVDLWFHSKVMNVLILH